jgi:phthalate 4,5-dioxygenase oxygenase subunit
MRDCNWMQAIEGDIDTTHLQFLHSILDADPLPGTFDYYLIRDRAPRYQVVETEYGAMYGTFRDADEGNTYWRIGNWLFPFYSQPPTGILEPGRAGHRCWVPLDDEHSMLWNIFGGAVRRGQPAEGAGNGRWRRLGGDAAPQVAPPEFFERAQALVRNTTDWLGRWRLEAGIENDYYIDREVQRTFTFTGIGSIHLQDEMVTESMGPIYTRDKEHLGTSDAMVIRVRRMLINAAKALRDRGEIPPGVDSPEVYLTRVGGIVLPKDTDWLEATAEVRKARLDDVWPSPVPAQVS